MCNWCI